MVLHKNPSDCLACTFRAIFFMGSICGSSIITGNCSHSKNPSSVQKFSKSTKSQILSCIFNLTIILSTFYYLYGLFVYKSNEWEVLFKVSIILENVDWLSFSLQGLVNYNKKLIELNGLTFLIQNKKYYGCRTFLTSELSEELIRKSYISIIISALIQIFVLIHTFVNLANESLLKFLFIVVAASLYNYSRLISVSQSILANVLYKRLFQECFKEIKAVLTKHILKMQIRNFVVKEIAIVLPKDTPLEEKLKRLKSLYTSLSFNYKQFNLFNLPSLLIGWLILIMTQISNFFLLILLYRINNNIDGGNFIIILEACGVTIGAILFLKVTEEVSTVVSVLMYFIT